MVHIADARFIEGNLMRHVSSMSLTASIGLMAIFAVDLIDIIFISFLGYQPLAAAAGYASTLMFFTSAVNIGLSIAAAALVSRAIGEGKDGDAREYASSVAIISVLVSILLPVLILPNVEYLLSLIGATGEVAEMAARYLWIILPSTVFSGLSMTAVAVLRAHGDGQRAMYPSLVGGGVNLILDPILIFSLGLGLDGAAFATVLARAATLVIALYYTFYRYQAFTVPRLQCLRRDFKMAIKIAVPVVLATVATPFGGAIVTREIAQFGTEAVAGMAIIGRLIPVVFAVLLALSGAIGPIVGQNYGAGRIDRVKEAFLDSLIFVAVYVLIATVALFFLKEQIADLFDATGLSRTLIFLFCGPIALSWFFNGAIYVSNASFNNLGHPAYSTWVNWGRNTIGTWPMAILGAQLWGAQGVLIGQAAGGAIFAGIAVWLSLRVMRNPCDTPKLPYFRYRQHRMHVVCSRCTR